MLVIVQVAGGLIDGCFLDRSIKSNEFRGADSSSVPGLSHNTVISQSHVIAPYVIEQ